MSGARKIVVEATIPAPVALVWERTQQPEQHVRWDLRFDHIGYVAAIDARGFRKLDYRTRIGFGVEVQGFGGYLHSTPLEHSTFEFDSTDWKSLITNGRGVWIYQPRGDATYFKTVYDYDVRYGWVGRFIDWFAFRPLLRIATEWSFETLRQWCAGDEAVVKRRRARWRFLPYLILRLLRWPPPQGAARSWLGSGQ